MISIAISLTMMLLAGFAGIYVIKKRGKNEKGRD